MNKNGRGILANLDASDDAIADEMERAIADALRAHKQAGNPIAVWDWEADRVVIVPAEEIVIPGEAGRTSDPETPTNGVPRTR